MELVVLLIFVLVNVAFITLLERKILGYRQSRLGPNKPSFVGLLQPIADAVKLFSKSYNYIRRSHRLTFLISPCIRLSIILGVWCVIPVVGTSIYYKYSYITLLVLLSLNVYPVLIRGWSSRSKYALLGAMRAVAQTISYEVRLALILMVIVLYRGSLSILGTVMRKAYFRVISLFPVILFLWFLRGLAETNRTPFDFAEGERELVSGFNIEYGAGGFAIIFMAEYGRIYAMASLRVMFLFPFRGLLILSIYVSLIVGFWVWARTTYPRFRYDLLINLAWKRILPFILALLLCVRGFIII